MKKLTLILTLLLCSLLPSAAENKIEANPINLAAILTEKNDSSTMASVCEYYGYHFSGSKTEDSNYKTEYTHPNGSIIRYSFSTGNDGKQYQTIEVKASGTHKELEKILQDLRFQKTGNIYQRRSFSNITECTLSHG